MSTKWRKGAASGISRPRDEAEHLIVLVHGILSSPSHWNYADAELKRRLGSNYLIFASASNMNSKTLNGIDAAGRRLADEIQEVVQTTISLRKISFVAHSLGGLFARYAIALLYSSEEEAEKDSIYSSQDSQGSGFSSKEYKIAGLKPICFITLATPHLGVRGKRQLPFLFGVSILEKLASVIAPLFAGRTGHQLFLRDGEPDKAPLLLQMVSDQNDKKFISALSAFRSRSLYANVSYDHMVGWRTSSIRRDSELFKPRRQSLDGYKHVVNVEYYPPNFSERPQLPNKFSRAKKSVQATQNTKERAESHDLVEEKMIHGLQRLGWEKVDVSFHATLWPFFAHNNIHVKREWLHNAGAGVVAHVADTLKKQTSLPPNEVLDK